MQRYIRVFISSTFSDLQTERDALMKVIHEIQEIAARRDVTIVPVDLRWGINYRDARGGKVLQVCLEEIKNSYPFFIGIVGERYGWCPSMKEMEKNPLLGERYLWLKEMLDRGLSVTEIEMRYGVINASILRPEEQIKDEDIHAFFYVKGETKSDVKLDMRLTALKRLLKANGRFPCKTFVDDKSFQELVREDLKHTLDVLYPEGHLSELEKERILQSAFLRSRCDNYIPKEEYFKALDMFLETKSEHYKVVSGESGIGKSALLANWIQRHEQDDRYVLLYHFVGNGNQGGSYKNICNRL